MTRFDSQSDLGYRILVDFIYRNRTTAGAGLPSVSDDAGTKPPNSDSLRIEAISNTSTQLHESGQSDLVGKLPCFVVSL